VSSQLKNPVTTGGRIVDIILEMWAISVVAASAGSFAAFLQQKRARPLHGRVAIVTGAFDAEGGFRRWG
jgi:hypothetical protein